jgi:hypothetical protein
VQKPRAWRRILGAILYRERIAFIDSSQPEPRVRWTKAHETGHHIIPWHEDSYHLDGEATLFRDTREQLEHEANLAASHLIFQGSAFLKPALDYKVTINTPLAMAEDFGASRLATIRYYVENHPDSLAMVMAGRYRRMDGRVPVYAAIESATFHSRFGSFGALFPAQTLAIASGDGEPFGDIAQKAMTLGEVAAKDVPLVDLRGDAREFVAEAFYNQYSLIVMVTERRATRLGRRIRAHAS